MTIAEAIQELLTIIRALRQRYSQKRFTLDGRLVGDLGEILVQEAYDVELFAEQQKHHDGRTSDGRLVQIKTTMQNALTFPVDHVPDYYLGIKIQEDGSFVEVYNGPGEIAREAVTNRRPTKTNLHSVTISALTKLNQKVAKNGRISKRLKHSDGHNA